MSVIARFHSGVNRALRPVGVQVVRGFSSDAAVQSFLPARRTLAAAERAGLSLTDYIDQFSAKPGATAAAVKEMLTLADLSAPVRRVCEIGPGTGRYAEKVIAALHPEVYEAYETARDWLPHLSKLPGVKLHDADGRSLATTASGSVDLVHAHKIFVYVPLVTTVGYLWEMARVVRPGGALAFDIVTENCLDEPTISTWVFEGATLYSMIPRQWTVDLLGRAGLSLVGSSFVPMSGGRTELLVFRKQQAGEAGDQASADHGRTARELVGHGR
jgi:SAM-dependent methyltransferase